MPKKVYFLVDICEMKQILLFGAGKSATVLIKYLVDQADKNQWHVTVVDANIALAQSKLEGSQNGTALSFDINDNEKRAKQVKVSDLVISMLPPSLHILVAKECIQFGKHLLTASYVDDDIRSLEPQIKEKGILFLCEMGLDPGIDHMSAMKIIDEIRNENGRITSFRSHCGGLVAPESDDNPWHYKISWNPRNIVLAGKAGAMYRENGQNVREEYEKLFNADRMVEIPDLGVLSWYPNRDSLGYAPIYGLDNAHTFLRTTLRHPEFMYGWSNVIELELTNETPKYNSDGKSLATAFKEHLDSKDFGNWLQNKMARRFEETRGMLENLTRLMEAEKEAEETGEQIPESFMSADPDGNLNEIELDEVKTKAAAFVAHKMHEANLTLKQLMFLGLDDEETMMNRGKVSAADILQYAMERKLALCDEDRDMIVMLHEISYEINGKKKEIKSSLVVKGENGTNTAMAMTVGLPLGIAAKYILNGTIQTTGLHIPTIAEIYKPVLAELETLGVRFHEQTI
jgi:saccharopine dehydrogenase-like NADP-dependent oxidoreductase